MQTKLYYALLSPLLFAGAVIIGCSGDSDVSPTPSPTASIEPVATSPAPTSTQPAVVEPTAAPAATATAPPEPSATATRPARTFSNPVGNPAFETLTEAILRADAGKLAALTVLLELECTLQLGIGGPPRCAAGEAEGTVVRVFPFHGCEGEHIRAERLTQFLEQVVFARDRVPFAVLSLDEPGILPLFPRGPFGLIVELAATGNVIAGGMMFEADANATW